MSLHSVEETTHSTLVKSVPTWKVVVNSWVETASIGMSKRSEFCLLALHIYKIYDHYMSIVCHFLFWLHFFLASKSGSRSDRVQPNVFLQSYIPVSRSGSKSYTSCFSLLLMLTVVMTESLKSESGNPFSYGFSMKFDSNNHELWCRTSYHG